MVAIPSRMKIGGKIYIFYNSYYLKKQAQRAAKALRNEGHPARVVKLGKATAIKSNLWGVYYRI